MSRLSPGRAEGALQVLYAAPGLVLRPGGGPCEHFLAVGRALARRRDVQLSLVIGAPPRPVDPYSEAGVPPNCDYIELASPRDSWAVIDSLALGAHPMRYLQHVANVRRTAKRVASSSPDVVIERMWGFGGLLGQDLARRGVPWILEENGPPIKERSPARWTDALRHVYLWLSRRRARGMYRRADRLIVQSEGLRERLATGFGAERTAIEVIPNAVDQALLEVATDEATRLEARRDLALPADALIAVYAGSIDRHHHIAPVVRAFIGAERVRQETPRLKLVILGDGMDKVAVEELATNATPGSITVLAPQPRAELIRFLQAADLAIAPYDRGAFPGGRFDFSPLKIREALALDRPVAATAGTCADLHGASREWLFEVDEGGWGALFRGLPSREELARRGEGGRERMKQWTYDSVAARYVEVARAALRGREPERAGAAARAISGEPQ